MSKLANFVAEFVVEFVAEFVVEDQFHVSPGSRLFLQSSFVDVFEPGAPELLLKPEWQLEAMGSICGAGSFALQGPLFILVDERLDVICATLIQLIRNY